MALGFRNSYSLLKIPDKWKQFREVIPGNKSDRLVSFGSVLQLSVWLVSILQNMHGKAFLDLTRKIS